MATPALVVVQGTLPLLALSRAFSRDAQTLGLEEPTSTLAARAEFEVFDTFKALVKGRSALLISHRLSIVRMAESPCTCTGRLSRTYYSPSRCMWAAQSGSMSCGPCYRGCLALPRYSEHMGNV